MKKQLSRSTKKHAPRSPSPSSLQRQSQTIAEQQLPRIRSRSSARQNYNHYYIHPQLRYRNRVSNPKEVAENYSNDTYIYNNLHNQDFWNWAHPLGYVQVKPDPAPASSKINVAVLERFKRYLEHRGGKRVPLVITDILNQRGERQ